MPAVARPKYSKHGWPLFAAVHSFGHVAAGDATAVAVMVNRRFGVSLTVGGDQQGYRALVTPKVKLSQSRYAEIRAFVEGFNAAHD
ncbi:hypothetical protein [Lacipirellula parvula]|uniref:Uncharacterized protein n=1 Tax=Lacipirellula parvula TaxID=2650471 RepID=A0A5K7X8T1_9BACT|nr:hypothetical protein [Lacipirellula parvula]BBO33060.1 hypothetical protein PLANPX_2672 [Lacipirellula parvula]